MVNLKTYLKRFVRNGPALVPIKSIKCFFECLDLVTSVKRHFWNLEKANDELLSCCSPTEPLVATEAPSRHLNLLPIKSSSPSVWFLWKILWNHFPLFNVHNMCLGAGKLDIYSSLTFLLVHFNSRVILFFHYTFWRKKVYFMTDSEAWCLL